MLRRLRFKPSNELGSFSLPWNCTIQVPASDIIGQSIGMQGVYDLPLTEAIVRLADPGETALDLGGNIGYMALVLARAAGPGGRVISFEPNRDILPLLKENVAAWAALGIAPIEVREVAVSERDGEGLLGFPSEYGGNRGVASLESDAHAVQVGVRRLDSFAFNQVGVMKVDVEGHEAAVFEGARALLGATRIRDILFEEHAAYPARSHEILLEHGYRLFRISRNAWRPLLLAPEAPARQDYLPSNFLATADPARALSRFQAWGWNALSRGSGKSRGMKPRL